MTLVEQLNQVWLVDTGGDVQVYIVETGAASITINTTGGAAHIHNQAVASTEWIINHNLGFYPDVTVLSPGLAEVGAHVLHTSLNQARVYFVVPYSGIARCE